MSFLENCFTNTQQEKTYLFSNVTVLGLEAITSEDIYRIINGEEPSNSYNAEVDPAAFIDSSLTVNKEEGWIFLTFNGQSAKMTYSEVNILGNGLHDCVLRLENGEVVTDNAYIFDEESDTHIVFSNSDPLRLALVYK